MRRLIGALAAALVSAPALAGAEVTNKAAQETTVAGGTLVLVSYIALFVLLLGFVALLASRQRRDMRELDALTRRMDDVFDVEKGES